MNVERLRTLYAIIAGIPDERVDLENWRNKNEFDCGTIACAVGWACSYPEFNKQGLTVAADHISPIFKTATQEYYGWYAAENFFGLSASESRALFLKSPVQYYLDAISPGFAEDAGMSDKRKVLRRIRYLLLNRGHITKRRSNELFRYEQSLQ